MAPSHRSYNEVKLGMYGTHVVRLLLLVYPIIFNDAKILNAYRGDIEIPCNHEWVLERRWMTRGVDNLHVTFLIPLDCTVSERRSPTVTQSYVLALLYQLACTSPQN
jgi:hypothetical protein